MEWGASLKIFYAFSKWQPSPSSQAINDQPQREREREKGEQKKNITQDSFIISS